MSWNEKKVAGDFTIVLEAGERIVPGDAEIGLLLANMRLLAFEGKGVLKPVSDNGEIKSMNY